MIYEIDPDLALTRADFERARARVAPHVHRTPLLSSRTLSEEIMEDFPEAEVIVVPIGGGGLISGTAMVAKDINPEVRIIGVESSGAPAMRMSVEAGHRITLDRVDCIIDGLRVKRVGENTRSVCARFVEKIVTLPDEQIFDALLWLMARTKLVTEGAAAAPVAALLQGLIDAPPNTKVVAVLSGGNLDVEQLRGLTWN